MRSILFAIMAVMTLGALATSAAADPYDHHHRHCHYHHHHRYCR